MATNVPSIKFTSTGLVVPTDAEVLAGVQQDINTAMGGGLNPALETPQGQLASSWAAIINEKNAQIAYLVSQFDPAHAEGRFQDALGKIYFLQRIQATATVVTATCTGSQGTLISVGDLALNKATGDVYSCTTAATIGASETVDTTFACTVKGAINCAPGALDTIYQAVDGWESISNATEGVTGRDVETRAEFELRRKNSVALNSRSVVQAVRAAVLDVPDVIDAYVVDNPKATAQTIGGVSVPANTLYVAAVGGLAADVAKAIWEKNSAGTPTMGNVTESVEDASYSQPRPAYSVSFTTPADVPVYFDVQLRTNAALPSDIVTLVRDAVIAKFNEAAHIGATVYANEYSDVVNATNALAFVVNIQVGTTSPGAADYLDFNINQRPTLTAANITVSQV